MHSDIFRDGLRLTTYKHVEQQEQHQAANDVQWYFLFHTHKKSAAISAWGITADNINVRMSFIFCLQ
jgi:hypothetical protein